MRSLMLMLACCLGVSAVAADQEEVPQAIFDYVKQPEPDFAWDVVATKNYELGRLYQLRVTSQKWHDIVWKHAVEVYEPAEVTFKKHALLFVTGGSRPRSPSNDEIKSGLQLANMCGARVVMLHQVPNQPLFDERYEDDLITETWLKYLESGDETWPLLFPMVKSAVKTMDVVQELSKKEWSEPIDQFVITGASKRGWTSWLTPVVDDRVIGTAPIVIDVLNFRAQMKHQLNTWGKFSDQIIDYSSKGLIKGPDETESPREVALRTMMDPFTYRNRLELPKLMIVGTNDPYWVVDAMNLYWDDLVGKRYIRQIPNAGHGLDGGVDNALMTLAAFFRQTVSGADLPQISWKFSNGNDKLTLSMNSDRMPTAVRLWSAQSPSLDFRKAKWNSSDVDSANGKPTGTVRIPTNGHIALFGELEYKVGNQPWSLTTLVYRR